MPMPLKIYYSKEKVRGPQPILSWSLISTFYVSIKKKKKEQKCFEYAAAAAKLLQ